MFISVEAVRWVFTQSKSERSARLVLLAIATHCNDDGCCWPGMDALIRYTRLSKNTILQARDELVELKELGVEIGGRGAGDTNHYYLPAFMESRVQKGSVNSNKGSEPIEKGSTHLNPNKNLEEEVIEVGHRPIDFAEEAIRESQRTGQSADAILKRLRAGK